MAREFLRNEHPTFTARKDEWATNERRFRGGRHVAPELVPFDWESLPGQDLPAPKDAPRTSSPGDHYRLRQGQAVYPNFPASFAAMLVGHLMQKRPEADSGLNFGGLGKVKRVGPLASDAELVFYNADGVGTDGSQWDAWWDMVNQWAVVTGHRWLFVEATAQPGSNRAEVLAGRRPYLVHYSPLTVSNWHYEDGRLAWAVVRFGYRRPRLDASGALEGNAIEMGYRLLVRSGHAGLGDDYRAGGWWEFDKDGEPLAGIAGQARVGTWDATAGEIPLWPHFYERDADHFSRAGVTELGNAAVASMNLDSAATFDAWDAASSVTYLLGVDGASHQLVAKQLAEGSKVVSVPVSRDGVVPSLQDSAAGAVASGVLNERLNRIRETAKEVASLEVTSVPDSSGFSKEMGFAESKAPRLARLASEMETSQNIAITFLERRFGITAPSGSVRWTRQFDLQPLLDRLERYFALETQTGYRSPTVSARGMVLAAKDAGLLVDNDDETKIEAEFSASVAGVIAGQTGAQDREREFGAGGGPLDPEE